MSYGDRGHLPAGVALGVLTGMCGRLGGSAVSERRGVSRGGHLASRVHLLVGISDGCPGVGALGDVVSAGGQRGQDGERGSGALRHRALLGSETCPTGGLHGEAGMDQELTRIEDEVDELREQVSRLRAAVDALAPRHGQPRRPAPHGSR
jgi:hypothetical protein